MWEYSGGSDLFFFGYLGAVLRGGSDELGFEGCVGGEDRVCFV